MRSRRPTRPAFRGGQTLLEVLVAAGMMAVALAPALAYMRDGMERSRQLETRQLLNTLGAGQLDRELASAAANWDETDSSGDFAAEGYPQLNYTVTRSDDVSEGGLVDRLMSIRVTIWEDQNNDNALSSGEPQAAFRSKIAKLASYEAATTP